MIQEGFAGDKTCKGFDMLFKIIKLEDLILYICEKRADSLNFLLNGFGKIYLGVKFN